MAKAKKTAQDDTTTPTTPAAPAPAAKPDVPKKVATVTRKHFHMDAKPLNLGELFVGRFAQVTKGATAGPGNSLGFYFGDKIKVKIGDEWVDCQVGVNVTVIGSKDLPAMS